MIKKNIIIVSLIFVLTNCGFTPIYLKNNNVNFSIEQVSYTGDRELNNFLKTNLNQYKNQNSNNKIFIETKSDYTKNVFTKDVTGKITSYQLEAEVVFVIKPTNQKIRTTEKKIIKSIDDKFEETRLEKSIKQTFASSMTNKLISELIIN